MRRGPNTSTWMAITAASTVIPSMRRAQTGMGGALAWVDDNDIYFRASGRQSGAGDEPRMPAPTVRPVL